jgi:hypothetical protein
MSVNGVPAWVADDEKYLFTSKEEKVQWWVQSQDLTAKLEALSKQVDDQRDLLAAEAAGAFAGSAVRALIPADIIGALETANRAAALVPFLPIDAVTTHGDAVRAIIAHIAHVLQVVSKFLGVK